MQDHTRAWGAYAADAFVPVMPENNYSAPAVLVNVLDDVLPRWVWKPAGTVSYGGASGGIRPAQMLKLLITSLRVMPIPDSVNVAIFPPVRRRGRRCHAERSAGPLRQDDARRAAALRGAATDARQIVRIQSPRVGPRSPRLGVGHDLHYVERTNTLTEEESAPCPSPRKPSSKD